MAVGAGLEVVGGGGRAEEDEGERRVGGGVVVGGGEGGDGGVGVTLEDAVGRFGQGVLDLLRAVGLDGDAPGIIIGGGGGSELLEEVQDLRRNDIGR